MKNPGPIILLAGTLAVSGLTASFAQNSNPPAATMEQPANPPHASGSGTNPEGMGSTGWTGGSRGQTNDSATTTGQSTGARDSEAAKDQPPMATGKDLQGPPTQFPAGKTPE